MHRESVLWAYIVSIEMNVICCIYINQNPVYTVYISSFAHWTKKTVLSFKNILNADKHKWRASHMFTWYSIAIPNPRLCINLIYLCIHVYMRESLRFINFIRISLLVYALRAHLVRCCDTAKLWYTSSNSDTRLSEIAALYLYHSNTHNTHHQNNNNNNDNNDHGAMHRVTTEPAFGLFHFK